MSLRLFNFAKQKQDPNLHNNSCIATIYVCRTPVWWETSLGIWAKCNKNVIWVAPYNQWSALLKIMAIFEVEFLCFICIMSKHLCAKCRLISVRGVLDKRKDKAVPRVKVLSCQNGNKKFSIHCSNRHWSARWFCGMHDIYWETCFVSVIRDFSWLRLWVLEFGILKFWD